MVELTKYNTRVVRYSYCLTVSINHNVWIRWVGGGGVPWGYDTMGLFSVGEIWKRNDFICAVAFGKCGDDFGVKNVNNVDIGLGRPWDNMPLWIDLKLGIVGGLDEMGKGEISRVRGRWDEDLVGWVFVILMTNFTPHIIINPHQPSTPNNIILP